MKKWREADGNMNTGVSNVPHPGQRRSARNYRAEPYGYEDPGIPQGDQKNRQDGFDPYRAQRDAHANSAQKGDYVDHAKTDYRRYGDAARPGQRRRARFQSEDDR